MATLKVTSNDLELIKPMTPVQMLVLKRWNSSNVLVLHGSAGTGKTFIPVYKALEDTLKGKYKKTIMVRSAVSTRDIGFLPGDEEEKAAVYKESFKRICDFLFTKRNAFELLEAQKRIEFRLSSFLRGLTFDDCAIIVDECFPPDTEVLTDRGFIEFRNLDKGDKVGQVVGDKVEFVYPSRIINKPYKGDMITIYKDRFSLTTTAGHDLVYIDNKGEEYKQRADEKTHSHHSLKTSLARVEHDDVSELDKHVIRYLCAIQEDGCYQKTIKSNGVPHYYWCISFSKAHKIDLFRCTLDYLGIDYTEYPKDTRGRVVFYLGQSNPEGLLDNKTKTFDPRYILSKSIGWQTQFVQETWLWDGSVKGATPIYCSTNLDNIKLVQTVGHMAGYRCRIMSYIDKRKESYKTQYRLTFVDTIKVSLQKHNKVVSSYEGNVHCVEVPSGKIMVRQKGNIFVTGNCQNMTYQELHTLITRVGENTKIIFCGDTMQNDLYNKSGFERFLTVVSRMDSSEVFKFNIEDIVRSGVVKDFLTAEYRINMEK